MTPDLQWLRSEPGGAEWLDALPGLVRRCAERWQLALGEPFAGVWLSLVMPGRREGGEEVVLKLQWPHREVEHEALALSHWAGAGAVRLLDHDPEAHALLLERCLPGGPLADLPTDEQMAVYLALLPRLLKPAQAPPFRSLTEESVGWAERLRQGWEQHGRRFEERLVDAALAAIAELSGTQGEQVLLHQDLHSLNVLRADREPWLVIDPKPLAGEREFAVAPILRSFGREGAEGRRQVLKRLDELTSNLSLDRERARLWTVVQTVAWSLESDAGSPPINLVRWMLDG